MLLLRQRCVRPAGPQVSERVSSLTAPTLKSGATPLSPPVFREAHLNDLARRVYMMAAIITSGVVITVVLLIFFVPESVKPQAVGGICSIMSSLAAVAVVRSGRAIAGSQVLAGGMWVSGTALVLVSGGVAASAAAVMLAIIVFSSALLEWRGTVVVSALAALTIFGSAWLGAAGLISPAPVESSLWYRAGVLFAFVVVASPLLMWSTRSQREAVRAAREATEALSMAGKIYDTTSEGIVVTTPDGTIVDVNGGYLSIHGVERADVIGQNPRMHHSGKHDAAFYSDMWGMLLSTGRWQGEIWDRRSDGSLIAKWLSIFSVSNDEGQTTHYVGVFSDITALKQGELELEWFATHDPLTSLPNRALLDDRLTTALARSRRLRSTTAVLFFDLDHYKDVNDTLGHPAGDRVLVTIAERCLEVVRESDTVGRVGGDEFAVIVSDYPGVEELITLTNRLLSAIEKPITFDERDVHVTASIGVAVYPADGDDAETLWSHADLAMYRAKALGKNRFEFYSVGLRDEVRHRVKVETALRRALKDDRLFLVYQPQVDLTTGKVVAVEALVRWRGTDGSVIMPGDFIPIAESSGLILEVGDAVLRHAIADMKVLVGAGSHLTVAINVSARQWMEQDVATVVIEAIGAAGLDLDCFEVEVTESAIMAQTDLAGAKMRSLQEGGVIVSLDDFGTGYAPMSHIMDFRPNKLKIDRSFVKGLPEDSRSTAIVIATIALARGIGAKTVAEGPESEEQVRCLRKLGCDYAQGFYFSQGVPLDRLLELLEDGPFSLPDLR